jgi:DNA-binding beta-propeller fold protein YncE
VRGITRTCVVLAALWTGSFAVAQTGSAAPYRSPLAIVADKTGAVLYVAEYTGNAVAVIDRAGGSVTRRIALGEPPSALALAPDGARLYAAAAVPDGRIHVVNIATGAVEAALASGGHTPSALVVMPDGKSLYVCNRFTNEVVRLELPSGKELARIAVPREPVAAALTPDGATLFVANLLPRGPADGAYAAAEISVIDTASGAAVAPIRLPNGSTGLRGLCVSPNGARVYATHILARYQLPTTQLERGWMNTKALTIVDAAARAYVTTALLDDVDLGAANPWGVACTPDDAWLCIAHAGTHEVSVIDRAQLDARLAAVAAGNRVSEVSAALADVPNDLSFLAGIRRRVKLEGNGPRGLCIAGGKAYAAEYFTDGIGVVDIGTGVRGAPLALGPSGPPDAVRRGEMHFADAALCFQAWQSCTTCHPDGRVDGLNWDLMNDGLGNPRNTKSMLFTHVTPPSMITGVRATAEQAVRAGITHIQFAVRPEEEAAAIDEYLKALRPVPSPFLVKGALGPSAERGRAVFAKAGCVACHSGPYLTNLQLTDVGTGRERDAGVALDTPTLREAWRTAPYLSDGRAATMREVVTKCNPADRHGRTSHLSPEEIDDLVAFVLSQ